jgi:hypothetical protein
MTRLDLLAALVRESYGDPDAILAADRAAIVRERRRLLVEALAPRRGMRTRLHRRRLIVAHLEGVTPPWESREAWADEMFDGRAA